MYAPEFVASLPADQVRALVPRWLDLRAGTTDEVFRLTADLFLEAAHKKLAQQQERQEVAGRIAASPARQKYLPNGIGGLVEQIRQLPTQLDALADLLAGT